jgi:hypothetical protein
VEAEALETEELVVAADLGFILLLLDLLLDVAEAVEAESTVAQQIIRRVHPILQ